MHDVTPRPHALNQIVPMEGESRVATVLLVDDSADDRQRLRLMLEDMGHAVKEASSVQQALALVRQATPDMILSDIQIPGVDGFELCRQLQLDATLRHVPLALITEESGGPEIQRFAEDLGAVAMLRKPVTTQQLDAVVAAWLFFGFVPDATQKLRLLGNEDFHRRHSEELVAQLERKVADLERLSRRYKLRSETNHAIAHIGSREELLGAICRIAVEHGGVRLAAIVPTDQVDRHALLADSYRAAAGPRPGIDGALEEFADSRRGLGAKTLRSGQLLVVNDIANDPITVALRESARRAGIGAMAVYPLRHGGVVIGALEIYACAAGYFGPELLRTFEEMADDIAFGLHNHAREADHAVALQRTADALEYNRVLMESSPIGIIAYDAAGDVVSANAAAAKLTGGTQLALQNFHSIEAWKASGLLSLAEQALATNRTGDKEIHIPATTGGKEAWVRARLVPFEFRAQRHLLALLSDIRERHAAERHAEQQVQLHVAQLEAALMHTVGVATTLSEIRDPYTAGHERRVAEIAAAIGAELGFDERRQQGLRIAGRLHDVGKMSIPSEILSKPGNLTSIEYLMVKGHPEAGYDILKRVEFPWPVAQVALQHHERMDGSGYPQGLKGEKILLEARIISVADVVEAMSSHRPYRAGLGIDKALAEIERGRGSAYDPVVVDACLKLFRENRYQLPDAH